MASELDQKSLEEAFTGRADIQAAIRAAAGTFYTTIFAAMPLSYEYLY